MSFHVPHDKRIRTHPLLGSDDSIGNNGVFELKQNFKTSIFVIASDGEDEYNPLIKWEHVSVSVRDYDKPRTPTWDEMCLVKDTFWDEDDWVIQYHPAKSEYVNQHPHVLHLWRPDSPFPTPPKRYV